MATSKRIRVAYNNDEFTHIEVEVNYSKGGFNYFTGEHKRQGLYVYITPMRVMGNSFQTQPISSIDKSGFCVFIKDMKRNSQKQIDMVFQTILDNKIHEFIATEFGKQQYNNIVQKLQTTFDIKY